MDSNYPPLFVPTNHFSSLNKPVNGFNPYNNYHQYRKNPMPCLQPMIQSPVPSVNSQVPYPQFNNYVYFQPSAVPYPPPPNMMHYHSSSPSQGSEMYFNNVPPPSMCSPLLNGRNDYRFPKNNSYNKNNYKSKQEKPMFHCGTCDKSFMSSEKYQQHNEEHVSCGLDGCEFKAHPMVVEKHISMQHRTGLYKRIVKGNSAEEINQWINERKKHYPTRNKIEEKKVVSEEMEMRGERYDNRQKSFTNRRDNYREQRNSKQFSRGDRNKRSFNQKNVVENSYVMKVAPSLRKETEEVQRNLLSFRGTEYHLSHFETDESPIDSNEITICDKPSNEDRAENSQKPCKLINALALIRGYESTEEDSDDGNEEDGLEDRKNTVPATQKMETSDIESEPEEMPSNLPLPDFIIRDLAEAQVNSGTNIAENVKSKIPVPEITVVEKECDKDSESMDGTVKRLGRKRKRKTHNTNDESGKNDSNSNEKIPAISNCVNRRRKPPTLLEKLLSSEIKHERNMILQCVRYVVKNNYFDVIPKNESALSSDELKLKVG